MNNINDKKTVAIVLAAGKGKRMGLPVNKQFLTIKDKPVLFYSLKAFEESNVDEILVVASKEEAQKIKMEIIDKYKIDKISNIIIGGKERYNSVYNALVVSTNCDKVLIHDGARPFIKKDVINNLLNELLDNEAVILAVPAKDTIKRVDVNGYVIETLDRNQLYQVQTPQAFNYDKLKKAYDSIIEKIKLNKISESMITDDAMILESESKQTLIKVILGNYNNIKITTKEDLEIAKILMEE